MVAATGGDFFGLTLEGLLRPRSQELIIRSATLVCIYLLAFSIRLVSTVSCACLCVKSSLFSMPANQPNLVHIAGDDLSFPSAPCNSSYPSDVHSTQCYDMRASSMSLIRTSSESTMELNWVSTHADASLPPCSPISLSSSLLTTLATLAALGVSVQRAQLTLVLIVLRSYRSTIKLVTEGAYEFWNWFDHESWHPLGRVVGGTVFPGLMFTAAALYKVRLANGGLMGGLYMVPLRW